MYVLMFLILIAVAFLWRRVRKLEKAAAALPQPAASPDVEVRLQVLERAERNRALQDALS